LRIYFTVCVAEVSHRQSGENYVKELQNNFNTKKADEAPVADFSNHKGDLIIKTTNPVIDERGTLYEAVRWSWKISKKNAEKAKYVFAVVDGIIKGVFCPSKWLKVEDSDRMKFYGSEAPKKICDEFTGRRLPDDYVKRGAANPVMYIK